MWYFLPNSDQNASEPAEELLQLHATLILCDDTSQNVILVLLQVIAGKGISYVVFAQRLKCSLIDLKRQQHPGHHH